MRDRRTPEPGSSSPNWRRGTAQPSRRECLGSRLELPEYEKKPGRCAELALLGQSPQSRQAPRSHRRPECLACVLGSEVATLSDAPICLILGVLDVAGGGPDVIRLIGRILSLKRIADSPEFPSN